MSGKIGKAKNMFLAEPVSRRSLVLLLRRFHQIEADRDGPKVHHQPYDRWHGEFAADNRERITRHLDSSDSAAKSNAGMLLLRLAVLMRLEDAAPPVLARCAKRLLQADLSKMRTDLLFEAGNILMANRDWAALATVAREGLSRYEAYERRAAIFGDWFVLAEYRQLLPHFRKNRLTASQIDAFETVIGERVGQFGTDSKNALIYAAIVASLRRDIEAAVNLMLAAQDAEGVVLDLFHRHENFVAPADMRTETSPLYQRLLNELDVQDRHERNGDPVLLVSTDENYFTQYVEKLLESYGHWNPGALVHIHCVGFAPDEDALSGLEGNHGVKINYTVDHQTLLDLRQTDLNMGYCAGARYLFLPHYLERYRRVVITDMDGLIRRPLADLWDQGSDAILLTTKHLDPEWTSGRLVWEMIAANGFAIADTDANREFAFVLSAYLCDQIQSCMDSDQLLFYTDQIGLLSAFLRCQETCVFERCEGLFVQGTDWSFGQADAKRQIQHKKSYR